VLRGAHDRKHHGSGCWTWDHDGGHEYWRTVPLFVLWNGTTGGENQDGEPYIAWTELVGRSSWKGQWRRIMRPSQFRDEGSAYWRIVRKWHDALDAY
jgi:hypothetical protein